MNDFINSLRDKRIEGFKQRYRTYDLLLIDDIQFFEHKERIQEEFFHTFNSLYEAGRQIVISLGPPAARDRDARGAPALALRVGADHRHPAARPRDAHRDPAQEGQDGRDPRPRPARCSPSSPGACPTNIRELEGALTRVVAFSSLTGRPMTVELAQDVLQGRLPAGRARPRSRSTRIQELVSRALRRSRSRSSAATGARRTIVYPRQVAMYLSRELTDSSLPKIGREFGGRDHTTVIHATSKIARLIREDRVCVQPCAGADRAHQAAPLIWGHRTALERGVRTVDSPQSRPTGAIALSRNACAASSPSSTLPTTDYEVFN